MFTITKCIYPKGNGDNEAFNEMRNTLINSMCEKFRGKDFLNSRIFVGSNDDMVMISIMMGACNADGENAFYIGASFDDDFLMMNDAVGHVDIRIETDEEFQTTLNTPLSSACGFTRSFNVSSGIVTYVKTYDFINCNDENSMRIKTKNVLTQHTSVRPNKTWVIGFSYGNYEDSIQLKNDLNNIDKKYALTNKSANLESIKTGDLCRMLNDISDTLVNYVSHVNGETNTLSKTRIGEHDIDEMIYPLIKLINDRGFKTYMSCAGHSNDNGVTWPWIVIDTEYDFFDLPDGWDSEIFESTVGNMIKLEYHPSISSFENEYYEYGERIEAIMSLHEYFENIEMEEAINDSSVNTD